jgi:hypothetical protein
VCCGGQQRLFAFLMERHLGRTARCAGAAEVAQCSGMSRRQLPTDSDSTLKVLGQNQTKTNHSTRTRLKHQVPFRLSDVQALLNGLRVYGFYGFSAAYAYGVAPLQTTLLSVF